MLEVARAKRSAGEHYVEADACALPFGDGEFDYCVCVTALCFMRDQAAALAEMFRVTRRRVALGLLNRWSILWLQKGRLLARVAEAALPRRIPFGAFLAV